jgi:putative oxidoreductase
MPYGLLLLRVVVGGTMFSHGAQKLFGWFGGPGLRGTAGFFGSLGWRAPLALAFLAGLAETSGLALALGFLTPLAALGITVVLLNAILVVTGRTASSTATAASSSRSRLRASPSRWPPPDRAGSRSIA